MDNTNIHNIKVGDQIRIISVFDVIEVTSEGYRLSYKGKPQGFRDWGGFNNSVKIGNYEIIRKQEDMLTELPENWYVVVTAENEETLLKWLPNSSKYNTPYIIGLYSWKHELSKKVKGQTHLANLAKDTKSYTFGKEISFEDFKRLVLKEEKMYTKEDILKEGIVVFLETEEEHRELSNFIGRTITGEFKGAHYYRLSDNTYSGDSSKGNLGYYKIGNYKGINFNQIQMNKKIIGYKAPMDLYAGGVKKGHLYVKNSTDSYRPETKVIGLERELIMPSTLVETWEPVYKQQKLNKVGVHDVTYPSKTVVKIGCTEYEKSQLKGAEMLLETKNIKYIMCDDDTKIDIGIIRQLIQGLES